MQAWDGLRSHGSDLVVGHLMDYVTDEALMALWTHMKDKPVLPPSGDWVHNFS